MTSSRPYLIRALYEWIADNGLTPHIVVDARIAGTQVPERSVTEDGKVVFNIGAQAVSGLDLGNEEISFEARFTGVKERVVAPMGSILAVYARENGQGMMFPREEEPPPDKADPVREDSPGSHLKVVK